MQTHLYMFIGPSQGIQWDMDCFGLLANKHCVALAKGAAPNILATNANIVPYIDRKTCWINKLD